MNSAKLFWTQQAREDLRSIALFIGQHNSSAARRWIERLRARARTAARAPNSGRIVPEFGRADVRELIMRGYRLVYKVRGDRVDVLTVFEGHRLLPIEPPPEEG